MEVLFKNKRLLPHVLHVRQVDLFTLKHLELILQNDIFEGFEGSDENYMNIRSLSITKYDTIQFIELFLKFENFDYI